MSSSRKILSAQEIKSGLTVEPFSEVYFNHQIRYDFANHGDKETVYLLLGIAISILIIACFNYVNLSVAFVIQRAKEASIRKILGTNRLRLALQFIGESMAVVILSLSVALILLESLLGLLNNTFGLDVQTYWTNPEVQLFFLGLALTIVFVSGIYPAIMLSSFNPLHVIKGNFKIRHKAKMQKVLLTAQFATSIFMVIATLLVSEQMRFIQSKPLGHEKEAIIVVTKNASIRENYESFRAKLLSNTLIKSVSSMSGTPGGFHDATTLEFGGVYPNLRVNTVFTDPHYLKTLAIEVAAGRDFSEDLQSDVGHAAIINERAVREMGLTNDQILGQSFRISLWDSLERKIVGVARDFHFKSLKNEIDPMVIIPGHKALARCRTG